jgi:hypothetical protein
MTIRTFLLFLPSLTEACDREENIGFSAPFPWNNVLRSFAAKGPEARRREIRCVSKEETTADCMGTIHGSFCVLFFTWFRNA